MRERSTKAARHPRDTMTRTARRMTATAVVAGLAIELSGCALPRRTRSQQPARLSAHSRREHAHPRPSTPFHAPETVSARQTFLVRRDGYWRGEAVAVAVAVAGAST